MNADLQECFHLTTSCLTPDSVSQKTGCVNIWGHICQEPVERAYSLVAKQGWSAIRTVPRGGASRALGPALAALGAGRRPGNPGAPRSASRFRGSAVTCTARATPGGGRSLEERGRSPAVAAGGGSLERGARRTRQAAGGSSGRSPGRLAAHSGRLGAAAGAPHGSVRGGRRGAGAAGPHGQRRHSGRTPIGPPIRGRHHPDHAASAAAWTQSGRPEPLSPVAAASCMGSAGCAREDAPAGVAPAGGLGGGA